MTKTNFNQLKHLITINNEIKDDISFFQFDWNKINIKFKNNSKIYSYRSNNIEIYKVPKNLNLEKNLFFHKWKILFNLEKILDFWDWYYRIFSKNWFVFSSDNLKIKENIMEKEEIKDILEYLRTILNSRSSDDITNYLKKEFSKLDFILPNSVLNDFLLKKNNDKSKIFQPKKLIYPFNFNLSQKKALENAFKSNISVIEWPPWTWKTQTILNIIANIAIMRDKTVAVLSNNNSAIANVKEKLEKEDYSFFTSMLWKKENKINFFNNIPDVKKFKLENVENCSSKLEEISTLMEINNKKHKLETELSDYILEKQHFDNYFKKQNIKEIFKLPLWTKNSDKLMDFLAENSKKSKDNKKKSIFFKIKLFIKYWFVEFKKLNTNEIDLILSYQKAFYELKTEELTTLITSFNDKLNKDNYDDLIFEYIKYSKIQFKKKLNSKFKNLDNLEFTEKTYFKEFSSFINRFPVVFSSTYAILNSVPKWFLFDYIIIDESSQVDLITWMLAFSCCENVIIVWDTKQLPHIVNWKKLDNLNIDQDFDYYKHNILSSTLDIYKENIPVTLLKEHYRCHPKIINFCNQKYYNWELIIYTKENKDDKALTIYRSTEWNHMRDIKNWESNWKYNQREIDIIEDILIKKEEVNENDDIWIISPIKRQAQKIYEKFNKQIEADTVHKFQWREKDIIIFSTVLDNTKSWNMVMKFVDNPNLINVSVSRAKNKFIVVTDNQLFFKKWKEIKDLVKYVEYSSLDENIIESDVVWVFDLLYKNYSNKITLKEESLIGDSKYKSENIWNTLIWKILDDEKFSNLSFGREVYLKSMIWDSSKLNDIELKFLNSTSRVDFLIYADFWKTPLLVIEVDWIAFHENNTEQIVRDKKKNSILDKYNIPYLRLKTNWSWEDKRVYDKLLEIVNYE